MKLFYRKLKWLLFSRKTVTYENLTFLYAKGSNGTHYASSGARVRCINCIFSE